MLGLPTWGLWVFFLTAAQFETMFLMLMACPLEDVSLSSVLSWHVGMNECIRKWLWWQVPSTDSAEAYWPCHIPGQRWGIRVKDFCGIIGRYTWLITGMVRFLRNIPLEFGGSVGAEGSCWAKLKKAFLSPSAHESITDAVPTCILITKGSGPWSKSTTPELQLIDETNRQPKYPAVAHWYIHTMKFYPVVKNVWIMNVRHDWGESQQHCREYKKVSCYYHLPDASITSLSHVATSKHLEATEGPWGTQTLTQMDLDIVGVWKYF